MPGAQGGIVLDLMPLDPEWVEWGARYRWHVDQLPALFEALREMRVPSMTARTDVERVAGSSAEGPPVPLQVGPVDVVDELWAVVVEYVDEVAELIGHAPPQVVARAWRRRGVPAGVRPLSEGVAVRRAAHEVTNWLIIHLEAIAVHSQLADSEDHLFELIRKHRSRYVAERTRARRRVCPVCEERSVVVEWAMLAGADEAEGIGRCTSCGTGFRREAS
ncbi:hypothetical protein [Microbacterium halotolerans]|uniref:hypothetical protein n=1 Tax=Microbacterium halotolerans TaxID=246613 RepID=UPI0019692CCD|nr:hypothetical protein [Microbacterium halotolerans]